MSSQNDSVPQQMENRANYKYPRGCNSARVIRVIETRSPRGSGMSSDDPVRVVTEFWTLEGKKFAEIDPYTKGR